MESQNVNDNNKVQMKQPFQMQPFQKQPVQGQAGQGQNVGMSSMLRPREQYRCVCLTRAVAISDLVYVISSGLLVILLTVLSSGGDENAKSTEHPHSSNSNITTEQAQDKQQDNTNSGFNAALYVVVGPYFILLILEAVHDWRLLIAARLVKNNKTAHDPLMALEYAKLWFIFTCLLLIINISLTILASIYLQKQTNEFSYRKLEIQLALAMCSISLIVRSLYILIVFFFIRELQRVRVVPADGGAVPLPGGVNDAAAKEQGNAETNNAAQTLENA